jgi:hypothetical protein
VELLLEDRKMLYEGAEFIFGNLGSRDETIEMRGNLVLAVGYFGKLFAGAYPLNAIPICVYNGVMDDRLLSTEGKENRRKGVFS